MTESAFVGAGKTPGLELWRIENLAPIKQAAVNGKFHVGDSYILLSTTLSKSGVLTWAIHFWLGEESTHDERGIAAYKTVELEDFLGGGPVQYREIQGAESPLFLSYFKNSGHIEYLPGEVESGFRTVERYIYETRLLHLKGRRTVRVTSVPIVVPSLNKGDVFILDAGLKIYIFNGPTSNDFVKAKGVEVASHIKDDERGGRAEIILLHENPENVDFWGHFGGFVDPSALPEGESDAVADQHLTRKLFQISDASGSLEFLEFLEIAPAKAPHKYSKAQLVSNDVFLLQNIRGMIYLWIGKGAKLKEKKEATGRAVQYVLKHGLPADTRIERVSEGTETAAFKSEFFQWDAPINFKQQQHQNSRSIAGATADKAIDVSALLARKREEDTPVDDGSGKLTVWVVKDFKKVEVDPAQYGHFFGGDSYIVLYSNCKPGKHTGSGTEEYIIYFWLGNDSTADVKGAAALLTVELDDSMGDKPVQVRVTQGKEPAHFRQLFKGKMIIFKGGNASGFTSGGNSSQVEQADVALFHIKGTSALNTMAVEVAARASSLNSDDSFVLVTSTSVYVWQGRCANADEVTVATSTATTLAACYKGRGGREVVPLQEGAEPDEFWTAMGGREEYPSSGEGEEGPRDARLFFTSTGCFKVDEINAFEQSDLNDEDVFLLDTYTQLFVWIGSQATQQEKDKGMELAVQYAFDVAAVEGGGDGRDPHNPIIRVTAGNEPRMFSAHFQVWDDLFYSKRALQDPNHTRLEALAVTMKSIAAPTVALRRTPSAPTVTAAATNAIITTAAEPAHTPVAAPAPSSYGPPVPCSHTVEALKNGPRPAIMPCIIAVPVAGVGEVYPCAIGRTVDWAKIHIRETFNITGGSIFCDDIGADEADVIEVDKVYRFVGGSVQVAAAANLPTVLQTSAGLPRVNLRASLSTLAPVALSENACAYLIGATDTVNYIFDHVRANISRVTTTYFRKTIGLISRCPRGGKTTIVQLLHQRLRAVGTNVQTISFNGVSGFVRIAGENPVESLYRLITNQLDDTIGKQAPRLVNWEDLDCYIGEAPFVLIIDELNVLCTPIGSELALVLKTFFLDKRNRYLVVTSHQPFLEECATNDEDSSGQRNLPRMWSDSVSLLSDRSLTLIPMPTSNNVEQLQSMHTTACSRITNALAAYYGYMPSLMYAVCVQSEESPAVRFSRVVRGTSSDWPELIEFVKAVMTGVPSQRLQRFMCFVSSAEVTSGVGIQVKWPLCYTASILRHYPGREPYGDIAGCIDKLEGDCEMVGNRVVWEQSVRIAILFKFVLAVSCAWDLPFGLCRPEEAQGAHVIVQHLGMGIITTEQCKRVIQDRKKKFLANTLVLFIPTGATLTQFDGYCVRYQEAEVRNVCAYQCKDNNKGADGVVPDWISEGGHLLRSDAPGKCRTTGQNNKRWTYYDAADTDGLLGWSLRVMRL